MAIIKQLPVTNWKLAEAGNKNIEESLVKEFGIHPIISQLLANRDILDMEGAHRFFKPSLNDLHLSLIHI